ncbi:MAG: EF-hand domain-containing protein [Lentisphaerae bacterium]|nr:EF-hand domain-containing protein [Lentisphaerota bacterium]
MKTVWILVLGLAAAASAPAAPKADPAAPAPTNFAKLDADDDGFLSETEFVGGGGTNLTAIAPVRQLELRKEFQKMDDDRDRKVSAAEFDKAHEPKAKAEPKSAEKKDGGKGNSRSLRKKAQQLAKRMKQAQGGK